MKHVIRRLAAAAAIAALVLTTGGAVGAVSASAAASDVASNSDPNYLLALNTAAVLSLLNGTVLPLLVGLAIKRSMNAGLKAAILAGASSLSSVLTQWAQAVHDHQHFVWQSAVAGALVTWITAELAYFKVWKPSGIASWVQTKGNADQPLDSSMFAYGSYDSVAELAAPDEPATPDAGGAPAGPLGSYEPRHVEDASP